MIRAEINWKYYVSLDYEKILIRGRGEFIPGFIAYINLVVGHTASYAGY